LSKKIEQMVEQCVQGTVEGLGFELADVQYAKENGEWVLTLYIYKEGGVNINDCEQVSNAVDPLLDELDPIEGAYMLSVSSIDLDRPLKKPRDFERNLGNEVSVHLYAPIEKKKEFIGNLLRADENFIVIEENGKERSFERKAVSLVRPTVHF
jgi:ribosome maturation factor RimP